MKTIDNLIIGHYDVDPLQLINMLKGSSGNSVAFRDFSLGFINHKGFPYSVTRLVNEFAEDTEDLILAKNTFNNAIGYLGTYLKKHNLTYDYVTSLHEEEDRLRDILLNNNVLSVSILTTLYVSVQPILEVIEKIKKYNNKCKIIVGGPFIASFIKTSTQDEINYLFENEIKADYYVNSSQGEFALVSLIKALKNNNPVDSIENILYSTKDGLTQNAKSNEDNKLFENTVNWKLFEGDNKPFVNLRTAISCPFSCAFCGFPETAGKYQTNQVDYIESELNLLVESNPSLKSVYFVDDTFNVPKQRFKDILKMMITNKYGFKWHSYIRCQFLDEETVELMKESGCEGSFLGIESGDNDILRNMHKQSKVEDYVKGIEMLKKVGITTFGAFVIGFPGETLQTIRNTIAFIESSGLDFFRAQPWYYEHITPIRREREKYNIIGEGYDWKHATMSSTTAVGFVEKVFREVKNSIWLPQFDFDFENIWRLAHQGRSLDQIKDLVVSFNKGIREKIKDGDVSDDRLRDIVSKINYKQVLVN